MLQIAVCTEEDAFAAIFGAQRGKLQLDVGLPSSPHTSVATRLVADDFFAGLFAALALRGQTALSIRADRFDGSFKSVFDELNRRAQGEDIDIRFRIKPHPLHGDSSTVRDGIAAAAQRGLISFDSPECQDIRLRLGSDDADELLKHIPGKQKLFNHLADTFLASYTAGS